MKNILVIIIAFLLACSGVGGNKKTVTPAVQDYKGYKIPTTPEGYVLVNDQTLYGKKPVQVPPTIEKITPPKEIIPTESKPPLSKTPRVTPQKDTIPPTNNPPSYSPPPATLQQEITPQRENVGQEYPPNPEEYPTEYVQDDFIFIPTDLWVNQNVGNQKEEEW